MSSDLNKQGYFVGKIVKAASARFDAKMTEPPKRYTEDALIADMLSAHKFAKSDADKVILKETEGLGTSRTRAPTIEGLIKGGFLVSKKKRKLHEITSTEVARMILANLPDVLTGVATTAKWEVAFKMIEKGQVKPEQVRQALKENLDFIVETARSQGSIRLPGVSAAAKGASPSARFSGVKTSPAKTPGAASSSAAKAPPSGGKSGSSGGRSSWFR